jgi:hypothetical protein
LAELLQFLGFIDGGGRGLWDVADAVCDAGEAVDGALIIQ